MAEATTSSSSSSSSTRKKLLGAFVTLAVAGLLIGLLGAFKPDAYRNNKASDLKTNDHPTIVASGTGAVKDQGGDAAPIVTPVAAPKAEEPVTTTTTTDNKIAPVPGMETPTTITPIMKTGGNSDLLSGLLKNQQPSSATAAGAGEDADANTSTIALLAKQKEAFLNTLVQATSVLGNAAANTAAGDGVGGACVPEDGLDLRRMVEDPTSCTVITLQPGVVYNVALPEEDDDITVSSRKVIIGNPLLLPTIDGADCIRIFHIVAGGSLDLQFVRTYRGGGELIATIPVLRGGTALIELGGRFNAFGCIFTNAPPIGMPVVLIAPDISRAVRIFGGQIFNVGGVMAITLCHFWVMQPGVLVREIYVIGADVLVISGVAVFSGCTFTNSQLFLNGFGVGFQLAVLGGVLICSGVTFTINFLAINASGAGILVFLGGGVGIFSGCTFNANLGVLTHFGSGIFLFEGGGVLVISGAAFAANVGAGIEAGTGVMISLGGGTLTCTGVTQEFSAGVDYVTGAGVFNWVGAGSAVFVGFTEARTVGAVGVYAIGGSVALGAGDLVTVGATNADDYGVAAIVLIGGDWFCGAGILVEIAAPFTKNAGVLWATFIGIDGFVGAGTAVVGYSPHSINIGRAWLNKGASLYFVNGAAVTPEWNAFVVSGKNGGEQSPLKNAFNLTAGRPGKQGGRRRVLLEATEAVLPTWGSFNVLQGSNSVNEGTPSDFISKLQGTAVGAGNHTLEVAYANLQGASTTCNACGFKGDVATQFIGEAAGACANTQGVTDICSMNNVQVAKADGSMGALPNWILAAGNLYEPTSGKTNMIDTSVVTSTFKVGCSPADREKAATLGEEISSCLDTATVADAIKASMDDDCARVNLQARNALQVPGELKADIPDNFAESFPFSSHTDVYDLSFTTHDKACTDKVTAWIKGGADNEALLKSLASSSTADGDLILDATDVSLTTVHTVKGMDLANAIKQVTDVMATSAAQTGLPTILVASNSAANGAAVGRFAFPQIAPGAVANVALGNFADAKPISLELATKCLLGGGTGKTTNVPLGSFTPSTGTDALDQVPVTIPAGTTPGTYSIRATQGALSWCSQPMDVK